ncbi:hypothetical protein HJTV-2_gp86 [Haloarcula virus HJTV-2]|uniref:Uncharacterized protein n=1 Tax=Haloarcula virus HJTV-2 TaxID=2877986 RepID=A0AAE8XWC8_9CAUD|nr:hypothetical protein M1M33_gp061 [Haloarcula virus HJTV-2]UBF21565.1 hypothetical protein HRTV-24_gp79 [Halorubrum virus HRTV-24]UBF21706.1 hypothetical protein HJTV-2_gp86 [Haloarcula virus HJTV-2]
MDKDDAKQYVTEVQVGTDKKKQLGQYEPATAHTFLTAEIPHDENGDPVDDPAEVIEALEDLAWEATERSIMERWEKHVRKSDD